MMFILTATLILGLSTREVSSELQDVKQLASSQNEFAFKLLKSFSPEGNFFISPTSIYMALGMLFKGAKTTTAKEIRDAAGFSSFGLNDDNIHQTFKELLNTLHETSTEQKLKIFNAIFSQVNYTLLPEYKEALQSYYDAFTNEADFILEPEKAIESINLWVKESTDGKITKLMDQVDPLTRLVLLNANYFKGLWKNPFDPSNTHTNNFFNNGKDKVSVPLMYVEKRFRYKYFYDERFEVVQLPYKDDEITMTIILPSESEGLPSLEQRLNSSVVKNVISQLQETKLSVKIPKFKLEYGKKLKENLKQLGVNSAFENTGDLSGISGKKDLTVSDVIHKSFIEVNEEGTEAAAVTGIEIIYLSAVPYFYANHPFLFIIRHEETGLILFIGRVNEL